jgi:hypothetical protein
MKRALYPFLLAAIPVLALYQNNLFEVRAVDMLRPLLLAGLLTAVLYGLSLLLLRRGAGAALLTGLALIACCAYPWLFAACHALWPAMARHYLLLPLWAVLSALTGSWLLLWLRRSAPDLTMLTGFLNVVALMLCLLILLPIAWHFRVLLTKSPTPVPPISPTQPAEPQSAWVQQVLATCDPTQATKPDIYFIILDGYARGDILRSRYGFDNQEFLTWLRQRGFFVAEASHAYYAWTHPSLSATLNVDYLHNLLPADFGADAPTDYKQRYHYFTAQLNRTLIQPDRVRGLLRAAGYQTLLRETGYAATRPAHEPWQRVLLGPPSHFEQALLRKTVFWPWTEWVVSRLPKSAQPAWHPIVRLIQDIPVVADAPGPKFVFYHILAPHPPCCFDERGALVPPHPVFDASPWLDDVRGLPGYKEFLRTSYPRNVAGLNVHMRTALEALLRATHGQAIIIVQSDHGSHLNLDPYSAARTDVPERFGILNAIYLPPSIERAGLAPDLSAINTLRLVLNRALGCQLPMLENRAWYSIGDLTFTEVTGRLHESARQP